MSAVIAGLRRNMPGALLWGYTAAAAFSHYACRRPHIDNGQRRQAAAATYIRRIYTHTSAWLTPIRRLLRPLRRLFTTGCHATPRQ